MRISCIIPVRNAARWLGETLKSVRQQTRPPDEIVVVDDGSTDDSATVARQFGVVTYVRQIPLGPSAARNRGIEESTGDFVCFIDADDLWTEEKLAKQLAYLNASPRVGFCIGHVVQFRDGEGSGQVSVGKPVPGYTCGTLFARRSVFQRIGFLDQTLRHADAFDWFLRAKRHGIGEYLMPDVVLKRRLRPDSFSQIHSSESHLEYLKVLREQAHVNGIR